MISTHIKLASEATVFDLRHSEGGLESFRPSIHHELGLVHALSCDPMPVSRKEPIADP